jgi:DNA repair protein RadC
MLREVVAAYGLDTRKLNELVRLGGQVREALNDPNAPSEITALLDILQTLITPGERVQVKSPRDITPILLLQMGYLDHEEMRIICLNTKNFVVLNTTIYVGNVNTSIVRAAEVFRPAIATNSPAIIIAHNHPSNDVQPSPEDVLLTRELCDAGRRLDIELIDHLVVGQDKVLSMRERGLGFSK